MSPTPRPAPPVPEAVAGCRSVSASPFCPHNPGRLCASSCLGLCHVQCQGDPCTGHTREALTDHLVTECSSKHKPAAFRWLGTSILRLKGKPLNVVVFFQGVSTAFTTHSGFLDAHSTS